MIEYEKLLYEMDGNNDLRIKIVNYRWINKIQQELAEEREN